MMYNFIYKNLNSGLIVFETIGYDILETDKQFEKVTGLNIVKSNYIVVSITPIMSPLLIGTGN